MRLDSKLARVYEDMLSRAGNLPDSLKGKLGAPLVMGICDDFERSSFRLFYIGQESFGWGFNERRGAVRKPAWRPDLNSATRYGSAVEALFQSYEDFDFAENPDNSKNRNAPFWRAQRRLLNQLGESTHRAGAWSNLIRCDASPTGTPSVLRALSWDELQALLQWQGDLLLKELEVLNPKAVVIVSGPHYDCVIRYLLPDVMFEAVENDFGFSNREFARVRHEALPYSSFRSYHPAYLTRNGAFGLVDRLADLIRQEVGP